jgi:hypothetical protein
LARSLAGAKLALVKVFLPVLALLATLTACSPKRPAPPASPPPRPSAQASSPQPRTDLPGLAVVRALYAPKLTPFPDKPDHDPFFTAELAGALKKDSHPDEVGAVDFDYRYDAQDVQITDLQLTAVNTLDGERVAARFDNFQKPYEVDYDLVLTRDGWRVSDVSAPAQQGDQPWSLRAMLKLPSPDSEPPRRP